MSHAHTPPEKKLKHKLFHTIYGSVRKAGVMCSLWERIMYNVLTNLAAEIEILLCDIL